MNDPKFTQYLSLLDSIPISNDPIGILMGIAWQFEDYCEKTVPLPELIGKTGISQYTQIFYECVLNIPARIIYHRQEHNYKRLNSIAKIVNPDRRNEIQSDIYNHISSMHWLDGMNYLGELIGAWILSYPKEEILMYLKNLRHSITLKKWRDGQPAETFKRWYGLENEPEDEQLAIFCLTWWIALSYGGG